MKKLFLIILSLSLAAIAFAQSTEGVARTKAEPSTGSKPRTALVIGNARYQTAPLRNPVNDARTMSRLCTYESNSPLSFP